MEVKTCKYPYFFWFMNKYSDVSIEFPRIEYEGREYELFKFRKVYFLVLKYFFPLLILSFIFNRYDFQITFNRSVEFGFGIFLCLVYILIKKQIYFFLILIVTFVFMVFVCFILKDISIIAFSGKYFGVLVFLKMLFFDCFYTKAYVVIKQGKNVSHLLIEEKK